MNSDAIILEGINKTFEIRKNKIFSFKSNIFKKSTQLKVLQNVSLKVSKGEVFGIIGPNGSGKTTLLKIIAGIYNQDSGNITTHGRIAPLLQIGAGFHRELNAEENIVISGMLYGMSKEEIVEKVGKILKFAELEDFSEMKLKHYSAGMRVRLAFSTALQVNPDILLVDEILSVGDISFREKSFDAFLNFKKQKKTIILTSHSLNLVSQICDRVLLLHKGIPVMIGSPKEVIEKYKEISKN